MKNYTVKRYETADYVQWNAFIDKAKNATFLFHRDFMEYHSERFSDFSLLVFEDSKLVSVVPANRAEAMVFSHQGLSYGGFVIEANARMSKVLKIVREVLFFLNQNGIATFQVKLLPFFYNDFLSDETQYTLFLCDAKLVRRDCLSVIDLSKPFSYSENKKRKVKKGKSNGFLIVEENDFEGFWNQVLIPNLQQKHSVLPVHSLEEITLLKQRFPENIRQFNVYQNGEIVAGTTIFETPNAAHAQYISGNPEQNEVGSIDFLFNFLLQDIYPNKAFFDFGISNENAGRNLNEGLLYWKESFGAKAVMQDFYEIKTANFIQLENILI